MHPGAMKNRPFLRFGKYLNAGGISLPWYDLETTASTMEVAHELVKAGCSAWTVITASHQSSGRGTHGRSWSSQMGKGLWLSVILPPPREAADLSGLTLDTAHVLVQTFATFADCPFLIKHPNDIVVNGRKIAGILVESAIEEGTVKSVILGIGVNLLQTQEDFSRDGLPDATSLLIETGSAPERQHFLTTFIEHLHSSYILRYGQ